MLWAGFTGRLVLAGFLGAVSICGFAFSQTGAQDDCRTNPAIRCGPNRGRPTPTPTRGTNNNRRPPRPSGQNAPAASVSAAPLGLQWWLLKEDGKGALKPVNVVHDGARESLRVNATFSPNEQLRLAVRAEQDGYLYVIHQPSARGDGRLLFPSRYYKSGDGHVRKGQTFYLPDGLDSPVSWLSLSAGAASETLRLIFSPTRIGVLPNPSLTAGGEVTVKAQLIENMLQYSPQELTYKVGYDDVVTVTKKPNGRGNRNIIEVLTLSGTGADKAAASGPAEKD